MSALHDGKGYLVEKYRNVIFTKESRSTLTEKDTAKWQALGLGVSEAGIVDLPDGRRLSFSALEGTKRELQDIVREPKATTGVLDGQIKLNKDFAKESTLNLWREGAYPVIHIASHYNFNASDPTSSFLVVGDGKLSFSEMQDKDNLFGSVDLITLSACDTAMSGNGKEAEGFAYLAQSLGAKSVIASLWQVSDAGTPELMIRFYKLRAENPQITKGEAFRLAQLSLLGNESNENQKNTRNNRSIVVDLTREKTALPLFLKNANKPFAHPHYWSSFVLIGNWR
jgi:CHAT domain-containing protein